MRFKRWIAAVAIVAAAVVPAGSQPPSAEKFTAVEAVSPAEAIRQPLGQRVTVEFRVGTATMGRYTEYRVKEPRLLSLAPDTALGGGAQFETILVGKAVTHLDHLGLIEEDRPDKYFAGKVVRVTGRLEALGPDVARTYRVMVNSLDDFEVVRLRLK
jgi:hypothetical protein